MTTTDIKTLVYYRPKFGNAELITVKDQKRFEKLYGKNRPYNQFESLIEDENYGTGLHIVTEIMATIQCDRNLNAREEALRERIAKGLTQSQGRNSQYGSMSEFVEQNLAFELIQDAYTLFIKEGGDLKEASGDNGKGRALQAETFNRPFKEFFRLFNLPYPSIIKKMDEDEAKVKDIPKPVKFYKIKGLEGFANDQDSVFKCHTIKAALSFGFGYSHYEKDATSALSKRNLYAKFPYLGKVHQSMFGTDNMQLNVYDYADRNWAVQNVIHYLVTHGSVTLK